MCSLTLWMKFAAHYSSSFLHLGEWHHPHQEQNYLCYKRKLSKSYTTMMIEENITIGIYSKVLDEHFTCTQQNSIQNLKNKKPK